LILYVNGDSHSAGAEAVNSYCFANDDPRYTHLGRAAHPDNVKASYGQMLADQIKYNLICHAESGSSNQRIIRTTYNYLQTCKPNLVIVGWATWEREEVLIDGTLYQFSAGLQLDCWPPFPDAVKQRYKEWVVNRVDSKKYCESAQLDIWQLHQTLNNQSIPHLFFNTYSGLITDNHLDWGNAYYEPYSHQHSYFNLLKLWNYSTVNLDSYHYGVNAHTAWAKFLLTYLQNESIITT